MLVVAAVALLASTVSLPPPPIIEYPGAHVQTGTMTYRCYDSSSPISVTVGDADGALRLIRWSRDGEERPASQLAEVNNALQKMPTVHYVRAACAGGSEEVMFVGHDSAGKEMSVIASSIGNELAVHSYTSP